MSVNCCNPFVLEEGAPDTLLEYACGVRVCIDTGW
jgi:hypothetical protein